MAAIAQTQSLQQLQEAFLTYDDPIFEMKVSYPDDGRTTGNRVYNNTIIDAENAITEVRADDNDMDGNKLEDIYILRGSRRRRMR